MRRLCTKGGRAYLGRSVACREDTTETAVKQLSAPQKSAEGIVITEVMKARTVPGTRRD
jgi:hypothetical protein